MLFRSISMATFTVISLLYFTQNLAGESLSNCAGLEFDFDPLRVGLVDDLSNHASDGGFLFLGGEPLLFYSGSLQHGMVYLSHAHQDALARVTGLRERVKLSPEHSVPGRFR